MGRSSGRVLTARRIRYVLLTIVGLAMLWALIFVPEGDLYDTSVVEVFLMAIPATLFPILYTAFFKWWRTPLGRALFTKALGLCGLIDISCIYQIWNPHYFLRFHVQFIIFSLILLGLTYQLVVICKIKVEAVKENRRLKRETAAAPVDLPPTHRSSR